jgi:hypothetical protein
MVERALTEIRTHLQVDDPGAEGGQKGKQQGSSGQSSSMSSGDEVGSSSTGCDWIQAGAALTGQHSLGSCSPQCWGRWGGWQSRWKAGLTCM